MNTRCTQYVKADAQAASLFGSIKKVRYDKRIGLVEVSDGAKLGPAGTFTYYSPRSQAEFLGLTPCTEFEGFTLALDGGDLVLAKAQPTSVSAGDVSHYSIVRL